MTGDDNGPPLTLVMAYFNEEAIITQALASLVAQTDRGFRLAMVDNASTDASQEVAAAFLAEHPWLDVAWLREERKSQLFALQAGIARARTPFVGTVDADAIYPPDYVAQAMGMLAGGDDIVAAMAIDDRLRGPGARLLRWAQVLAWPRKCHAGGAGHVYRTSALRAVGSFDEEVWPFVLFDHELAHRLSTAGRLSYRWSHKISASDRRSSVAGRSWDPLERILYKLLPAPAMDWFFYRFLGPRLARRGAYAMQLRERPWEGAAS